ncbi:MAG: hypothetical protein HY895_02010 [Deltaproteobacteria bacterium]|nr:hypothetical protein [Deltaproteobacteria bacterium]
MMVLLAFGVWFCPEWVLQQQPGMCSFWGSAKIHKKQIVAGCAIPPGTKSPFALFAKRERGDFGIDSFEREMPMTTGNGLGWAAQPEAQAELHRSWRIVLGGAASRESATDSKAT